MPPHHLFCVPRHTQADDRKEWLRKFEPGTHVDYDVEEMLISDFIHKELILFSMADNVRSIPSMVDGLKPAQRKVRTEQCVLLRHGVVCASLIPDCAS